LNRNNYQSDTYWQDAIQDAYVIKLEKKMEFSNSTEEDKWIKTTAINIIQNIRRKNSHTVCFSDLCSIEDDIDVPERLGHFHTPQIEQMLTFHRFFQKIEPKYRAISVLHYAGFNNNEIAEIFKITLECLKKRIKRGKSKTFILKAQYF